MSAPNEKEFEASASGSRLHALTQYPEWKEFESLIDKLYDSALSELLQEENDRARGMITAIDSIMMKLYDGIAWGNKCRGRISQHYKGKGI